jgi:phosphatidylglycerophosphatase A
LRRCARNDSKGLVIARSGATKQSRSWLRDLGLPLWHPAVLLATWFGAGLLPWMPGTWGALAALPCAWAIATLAGPVGPAAATILTFALGCWAAATLTRASGQHDPGFIVVDEVAAQWFVLAVLGYWQGPLEWRTYLAAFLLFRVFDIVKPWPARLIERWVAGGLGIMLDDIVAALYALVVLLIGEGVLGVRL